MAKWFPTTEIWRQEPCEPEWARVRQLKTRLKAATETSVSCKYKVETVFACRTEVLHFASVKYWFLTTQHADCSNNNKQKVNNLDADKENGCSVFTILVSFYKWLFKGINWYQQKGVCHLSVKQVVTVKILTLSSLYHLQTRQELDFECNLSITLPSKFLKEICKTFSVFWGDDDDGTLHKYFHKSDDTQQFQSNKTESCTSCFIFYQVIIWDFK